MMGAWVGRVVRGSGSGFRSLVLALLAVLALQPRWRPACGGASTGSSAAAWMQAERQLREHARRELGDRLRKRRRAERCLDAAADRAGPFGAFASTPLISEDGIAYVQDLASNVMAYDLETGEQLWKVEYNAPTIGPNGLAYEDGVLFGVTNGDVFALDAESGRRSVEEEGSRLRIRRRGGPEPRLHHPAGGSGRRPLSVRGREGRRWTRSRVRRGDGRAALGVRHHRRARGRRDSLAEARGTRRSSTRRATSTTRSRTATTATTRPRARRTNASTRTAS